MKNIAVYLNLALEKNTPLSKADYIQSYFELSQEVAAREGKMFFVGNMDTYKGQGFFSRSWMYGDEGKFIDSGEVKADVVFDRGGFSPSDAVPTFNDPYINEICTDKWRTYQLLPSLSPKSFLATNKEEYSSAVKEINTDIVVVKPRFGSEGVGVIIDDKQKVASSITEETFPAVVQEFMDSSGGVPGIVQGTHDFRVAIFDGQPLYSYYRTPPSGSLKANVAQGGSFSMVDVSRIPADFLDILQKIDAIFSHLPHRFYGIDVALTPTGYKLIEMNSRLGLLPNKDALEFLILKQKLAEVLTSL